MLAPARYSPILAFPLLAAAPAGADIILADEGFLDRNADPTSMLFSVYNNFGLQANGGSSAAEVGVVNPITGTVGEAFSGDRSLTVFAVDDHVFTGSGELFELILGDEGQGSFPDFMGTNESTTAQRNLTQFDVANGGTGTLDLQFKYKVVDLSFVPGFDGNGTATLPTALDLGTVRLSYTDNDDNPIAPGSQTVVTQVAGGIGVNPSNPLRLEATGQWETATITMGVLDAQARADTNDGGLFDQDIATVLTLGFENQGDLNENLKIAYEVFIDDIRILTEVEDILGDYNDNGLVEQGDLNQVLNNWGQPFDQVAATWILQRPTEGIVDQAELNVVLNRWGSDSAPDFSGSAVPEPASLALLGAGALVLRRRR